MDHHCRVVVLEIQESGVFGANGKSNDGEPGFSFVKFSDMPVSQGLN